MDGPELTISRAKQWHIASGFDLFEFIPALGTAVQLLVPTLAIRFALLGTKLAVSMDLLEWI